MATVVQATCPGCKNVLRIPADWLQQSVKCKHCGMVLQARAPATTARPTTPPVPVSSTAARPTPPAPPLRSTPTPPVAAAPTPVAPPPLPQPMTSPPLPVAQQVAMPASAMAHGPAAGFDVFDEAVNDGPARRRNRRQKRKSGGWGPLIACLVVLVAGGGIAAFTWFKMNAATSDKAGPVASDDADAWGDLGGGNSKSTGKLSKTGGKAKADDDLPRGGALFPRRALVVSVHNYLYANPTQPGYPVPTTARNISRFTDRLARGFRIPNNQVAHLSDAAGKDLSRSPIKSVIEQTITNFLSTCREQDRIMLFFVGHAVEIEDQAYLVPIEGELEEVKTLIPLKWVYDQLAACKARQKVFVVDVCRFSPTNGAERPGAEPMGEKLDAALKSPPEGVQVWSACVAEQRSIETDDAPMGIFLDSMFDVLEKVSQGGIQGIQKPDSPFPLEQIASSVDRTMQKQLEELGLKQTARLVGAAPEGGAPYDRNEALPPAPQLANLPAGTGDSRKVRTVIEGVLAAIGTPPVKPGREDNTIRFDLLPPFDEKALAEYSDDTNPENPSKLREVIAEARKLLWAVNTYEPPPAIASEVGRLKSQIKVDLSVLADGYRAPAMEAPFKNAVLEDQNKAARILGQLSEIHDQLESEEVTAELEKESKRWQANYDFILARTKAQIAFLWEYQSMLGQMRKELPPMNPKVHGGWRLAAQPNLTGDSSGKRMAANSRKLLDKLVKEHKGTPWEILAKREKLTALGLEWQATR